MAEMTLARSIPDAPLVALADQCVQCGLCLPHCPTYRLDAVESESPRGRIAYMKALAGGQWPATETGDLHLDHCLGCRRCESVCPAGVQYGTLLAGARASQFQRSPPGWRERLQLHLLARPRLLALLVRGYRWAYPLLPVRLRALPRPPSAIPFAAPAVAGERTAALFTGCVARAYEAPARDSLLRLLEAIGWRGAVPAAQTCCGAAAVHAGDRAGAMALATHNRSAFAGHDTVLSLASGCHETLATSLGAGAVHDALAFLEAHGEALRFRSAAGRRVALHVPCTQRNVVHSDGALRRLLARIPDLQLVELPDTGCCGAAGLHMVNEAVRASALRAPLLQALAAASADQVLSGNIGCRLHLGNASHVPVRHPLEFLAEHLT